MCYLIFFQDSQWSDLDITDNAIEQLIRSETNTKQTQTEGKHFKLYQWVCEECDVAFGNLYAYDSHMVDKHLSKIVSDSSKPISEPVPGPSNVSNAGKYNYEPVPGPSSMSNAGKHCYEVVAGPSNMGHEEEVQMSAPKYFMCIKKDKISLDKELTKSAAKGKLSLNKGGKKKNITCGKKNITFGNDDFVLKKPNKVSFDDFTDDIIYMNCTKCKKPNCWGNCKE